MSEQASAKVKVESLPVRRRTRRGDARRLEIIARSTELFLARGYDGVSLDDVVKDAGGSKTNIYSFFGDKEGLFLASMAALIEELLTPMEALDTGDLPIAEALHAFGRNLLAILLTPRHLAYQRLVIAVSAQCKSVGQDWFHNGPHVTRQQIADLIMRHQRTGGVRGDVDPHNAALFFHDMITFDLLLRAMLFVGDMPSREEIDERVRQAVACFLPSLLRNPREN